MAATLDQVVDALGAFLAGSPAESTGNAAADRILNRPDSTPTSVDLRHSQYAQSFRQAAVRVQFNYDIAFEVLGLLDRIVDMIPGFLAGPIGSGQVVESRANFLDRVANTAGCSGAGPECWLSLLQKVGQRIGSR